MRPTDTVGAAALDWRAGDGARDASAAFRPQDRDPHNMSDNQSTTTPDAVDGSDERGFSELGLSEKVLQAVADLGY